METFYDIGTGDLKDIWDSDLDPTDALKLSADTDMQDWFLERDIKMPQVILHDKLISDALLGNLPIKTEHSYSLNSDGDSMPDSPGSLQAKMDDMEDECYPAISMNTATSNTRRLLDSTTLTHNSTSQFGTSIQNGSNLVHTSLRQSNSKQQPLIDQQPQQNQHLQQNQSICNAQLDTASISSSDVDIDDSFIKDEPMSPNSSCPSSPHSQSAYGISLNMANVAALTNSDLVFEHKNGSLQLSPASHSLLKNQQIIISGTPPSNSQQQRIVMPKLSVKMESQSTPQFGLPPTPPSSLPSDESEGNRSPEHNSPMSPPISQQPQQHSSSASHCSTLTISSRRSTNGGSSTSSSSSSSPASHLSSSRTGYSGSSTRQPIHTPLISSQPKGSTGTLVLTEEEKRTLLAEGYPIPTRLPLTKAEEKSLKKIRRKIKNKISAQESRRKKKEYMDQLERKVEILVSENSDYRKRVETLEDSNANLMSQLAKLQSMLSRQNQKRM